MACSAPDTNAAVVLVLGRGENYDITGKSEDGSWWRMCCFDGQEVWAKAEFVDTDGPVDGLPVAQAGPPSTYRSRHIDRYPPCHQLRHPQRQFHA